MNYGALFSSELQKRAVDEDGLTWKDVAWTGGKTALAGGILGGLSGGLLGADRGGRSSIPYGALGGAGSTLRGLGTGIAAAVPFLALGNLADEGGLPQHLAYGMGAGALLGGTAVGVNNAIWPREFKYRYALPIGAAIGTGIGAYAYLPDRAQNTILGGALGTLGGSLLGGLAARKLGRASTIAGGALGALGGGIAGYNW